MMHNLMVVLMVIMAVLLIVAVMLQRSKGSGILGGVNANQYFGVAKGNKLIARATWVLAVGLFVLFLAYSVL